MPREKYDDVIAMLKEKIEALNVGDPNDLNTHLGPLVSEQQRAEIDAQVQDALTKGAIAVTGGKALEKDGWYYAPTLLANVPKDARVLNEEVFGPVLPVIPYDTVEEALAMANELPFGLTGSVFGSTKKARKVAKELEAGCDLRLPQGSTFSRTQSVTHWMGLELR